MHTRWPHARDRDFQIVAANLDADAGADREPFLEIGGHYCGAEALSYQRMHVEGRIVLKTEEADHRGDRTLHVGELAVGKPQARGGAQDADGARGQAEAAENPGLPSLKAAISSMDLMGCEPAARHDPGHRPRAHPEAAHQGAGGGVDVEAAHSAVHRQAVLQARHGHELALVISDVSAVKQFWRHTPHQQ